MTFQNCEGNGTFLSNKNIQKNSIETDGSKGNYDFTVIDEDNENDSTDKGDVDQEGGEMTNEVDVDEKDVDQNVNYDVTLESIIFKNISIEAISETEVVVSWQLFEEAKGRLFYCESLDCDPEFGLMTMLEDNYLSFHRQKINNLKSDTNYSFQIYVQVKNESELADEFGSSEFLSEVKSFRTLKLTLRDADELSKEEVNETPLIDKVTVIDSTDVLRSSLQSKNAFQIFWVSSGSGPESRAKYYSLRAKERWNYANYVPPGQLTETPPPLSKNSEFHIPGSNGDFYTFITERKRALDVIQKVMTSMSNKGYGRSSVMAFNVEGGNAANGATYAWTQDINIRKSSVHFHRQIASALHLEAKNRGFSTFSILDYNSPRPLGETRLESEMDLAVSICKQVDGGLNGFGDGWAGLGPFMYLAPIRWMKFNGTIEQQKKWVDLFVEFYRRLVIAVPDQPMVPWIWPALWSPSDEISTYNNTNGTQFSTQMLTPQWNNAYYKAYLHPEVFKYALLELRKVGVKGVAIWNTNDDQGEEFKDRAWAGILKVIEDFMIETNVKRIDTDPL